MTRSRVPVCLSNSFIFFVVFSQMLSVGLPLVPKTQMKAVAVVEDTEIEQHAL